MFGCSLVRTGVCVCVCLHDSDGFSCAACMCQCKARTYGLIHTHCMCSTYILYARDSRAAKNTFMPQRVRSQPAETNLRSELLSPRKLQRGDELPLCSYPSKSLSLFCFRCLFSLSASSFSSRAFSLPPFSVMLPLHLSLPPSHASFF